MSRTIRRNVIALALAGALATAAQPVTARDSISPRPAAAPRAVLAGRLAPREPGLLDPAWAWFHQLWAKASALLDPTPPAPPPPCTSGCPSTDEGPIIDPNGRH